MSKTNYQCMYLIDQALYNKEILGSENIFNTFNSQHQTSLFQNDSLPTKPIMSQPQITIKNDSEQMKNNYLVENNSKDTKNSTRHDKEIQSDDVNTKFNESLNDISRLTNQTRNDICLDCSKTEDAMNDVEPKSYDNTNKSKTRHLQHDSSLMEDIEMTDIEPSSYDNTNKSKTTQHLQNDSGQVKEIGMNEVAPKNQVTTKKKSSFEENYDEESEEKEWSELKERLRRLREDFPDVDVDIESQPTVVKDTQKEFAKLKFKKKVKKAVEKKDQPKFKQQRADKNKSMFICGICNTKFRKYKTLKKHMYIHENRDKHSNRQKPSQDKNSKEMTLFKNVQVDEKLKSLPIVKKDIVENNSNIEHQRKDLNMIESETKHIQFLCGICNQKFVRFNALQRHMKNIHPDYFVDNRGNKRQISETFMPEKKFKHDGRVKRRRSQEIRDNGHYTKRHKPIQKKQLTYQNYFD